MPALTTAAIIAGATAAGAGIAKGVGEARAARKLFDEDMELELEELERRKKEEALGLTEMEEGAIRARFLAAQSGTQRQLQAQELEAAAASGAVSGRDVFLREQAKQAAARRQTQQENLAIVEADTAKAAAETARVDLLRQQRAAADAARIQGITNAVSGGLLGVSQAAGGYQAQQFQAQLAEAQVPQIDTESLFQQYGMPETGATFGGLVPSPYRF
jgi:hypothetical protein|tara:strand:- start:585 stop:1235 length:651 start_codon:yes stop_codon:yes gene_type:complete